MDEILFQWLQSIPGVGKEGAKRLLEHYADLHALSRATSSELLSVSGLEPQVVHALLARVRRATETVSTSDEKRPSLYLCPACGSFVSGGAARCLRCGSNFSGEEGEDAPSEEPQEGISTAPEKLCLSCGALIRYPTSTCKVCGHIYSASELETLPEANGNLFPEDSSLCPSCGAFIFGELRTCGICGRGVTEEQKLPTLPRNGKHLGRDFLTRWQRIAEGGDLPEKTKLELELEHYTKLLEIDSTLERAWYRRGKLLMSLGRVDEGIEAFEKAANLEVASKSAPKLQVQNILRTEEDMQATKLRRAPLLHQIDTKALQEALAFYDKLLHIDPGSKVAWETKGELLQRLGRTTEAMQAFRKARELDLTASTLERKFRSPLYEDRTIRSAGSKITGRTNGRINGRINGSPATLEGSVNGLTTGMFAPLGRTNGLINGNGLTNGRRGRYVAYQVNGKAEWKKSVVGIAAVVLLLLFAPLLANLLAGEGGGNVASIDGRFTEWSSIPEYVDSVLDQQANPDVNLVGYKVQSAGERLFVYFRVQGSAFTGRGPMGSDSFFAFVDSDANSDTGYSLGDVGADLLVEIYGWDQQVRGSEVFAFDPDASHNDWHGFTKIGTTSSAVTGSEVETVLGVRDSLAARIRIYAMDVLGDNDLGDFDASVGRITLSIDQLSVAPSVLGSSETAVLVFDSISVPRSTGINSFSFAKRGNLSDSSVILRLYEDNGNRALDEGDIFLGMSGVRNGEASFRLSDLQVSTQKHFLVTSEILGGQGQATFGLALVGVDTTSLVAIRKSDLTLSYFLSAPPEVVVDGAFGDWSAVATTLDPMEDVLSMEGSSYLNSNVDLVAAASQLGSKLSVLFRVDGTVLGGVDIPSIRQRTIPLPSEIDTDRDTVPDVVESALGSNLASDFNNDNVTDVASGGDVDGDGALDYGYGGMDYWLNTTIPAWYPAPYGGRNVSVYVGPLSLEPLEGLDKLTVYVDRDGNTSTGLRTYDQGQGFGMDYAMVVSGRNGRIVNASLFQHILGPDIPWQWISSVEAANDRTSLEAAVMGSILNLTSAYRLLFYATDWKFDYDSVQPLVSSKQLTHGLRSVAGDNVILNEISPAPNPEWIEIANPTSLPVNLQDWKIQISKANGFVTIFTFGSVVLGPWMSGGEYLAVDLPKNTLPNGITTVVLRDAAGNVVDQLTYPAGIGKPESYSRFKDAYTGLPVDTDSDADWYVSTNPLSPTRGGPNEQHQPTITVSKTTSSVSAAPGDLVVYTIYFNNTNSGMARNVWITDVLPSYLTYVSSSVSPTSIDGQTLTWSFTNVGPFSTNSVTVTAQVTSSAPDLSMQINNVDLQYTDQLGRPQPSSSSSASTLINRPVIVVSKIADKSSALPGEAITYTIYFNNTGSSSAANVWINDTLPDYVTYQSSSDPYESFSGTTYSWHFTNVAPGSHSLTVTVLVDSYAPSGSLVNWALLDYTAQNNYKLIGSSSSVVVAIPEFSDILIPLSIPIILFCLRRRFYKKEESE